MFMLLMDYHRLAPASGFLFKYRGANYLPTAAANRIRSGISMSVDMPYPVRKITFGLEDKAHLKTIVDTNPNVMFVDVRSDDEIEAAKLQRRSFIRGSYLLNSESLESARVSRDLPDKEAPTVVFCAKGGRAMVACKTLRGIGYPNVYNAGGFQDLDFMDK